MLSHYPEQAHLHAALKTYFADNGFAPDGGYTDDWVRIKIGPIPFLLPNTSARKRAVRHHDLHHIATGYATTFAGEAEIGAWEVASDCRDNLAAWMLNLLAMSQGLIFHPHKVYQAFIRGRHTQNTYALKYDEVLLERTVGELRAELGLDAPLLPASQADKLAFARWAGLALVIGALGVVVYLTPPVIALAAAWRWLR